ncbi:hypothetical protein PTKIN_Ptkin01aG0017400 [Pterospermum kingtungense]
MELCKRLAVLSTQVWLALAVSVTRALVLAKPDCPAHCGSLSIPYPFGTREGCFLKPNFHINCKDSTAFLANTDFVVTSISMEGQLQILKTISRDCYNDSGYEFPIISSSFNLSSTFDVSSKRNKFTVIGCNSYAYLKGLAGNKSYSAGCMSLCNGQNDVENGTCTGFGCCQIQIPPRLKSINVTAYSFPYNSNVSRFNNCSYAFIVEEKEFNFSPKYVRSIPNGEKFPMSLDWVVRNETCAVAKNTSNYACYQNSECYEHKDMGYFCKCSKGFEGNPYLPDGCLDKDECETSQPCIGKCENTPGGYNCLCPKGYEGDGKKDNGTGCTRTKKISPIIAAALGLSTWMLIIIFLHKSQLLIAPSVSDKLSF